MYVRPLPVTSRIRRSSQRNTEPLSWPHGGNAAGTRGCGRKALILGKVVLVTGVARQLGGRFVRRIQRDPEVDRVIAVDAVPPEHHLGGADFIQADIRQPTIARVLAETAADTIVHLDVTGTPLGSGNRASLKETNVIGTMQLLGACQKSPAVQRLVVKSSTNVYGSAPRDPAVFTETTPPKSLPSGGFAKDTVEVEGYVRGFARQPARRGRVRAAVRQHPGPDRGHPARLVLRAAGPADRVRLRPQAAVRARGRCDRGAADRLPRAQAGHAQQRHLQHRRRRRPAALPVLPAPRAPHRASAAPGRHLGGHAGAYAGDDGLLARADPAAHPRPGRGHGPDARNAGIPAQVHDRGNVRGLRP